MHTRLNFINQSKARNGPTVVFFQGNELEIAGEQPVAWRVIQRCAPGMNHPFTFHADVEINVGDAFGNFTQKLAGSAGQQLQVMPATSGLQIIPGGPSDHVANLTVRNSLAKGAVSVHVYRSGKLLARQTGVAPEQMAAFRLSPTIRMFATHYPEVFEGQVLDLETLGYTITEVSLLGIARADIVMTGGGEGPDANPFRFFLQNVEMA